MKTHFKPRICCFLATICILSGLFMSESTQAKSSVAVFNPVRLNTGVTAYAINLSDTGPAHFVQFSLNDPSALTAIKTTNQYIRAATFLLDWVLISEKMFCLRKIPYKLFGHRPQPFPCLSIASWRSIDEN